MKMKHAVFSIVALSAVFALSLPVFADEQGGHHGGTGEEVHIPNTVPGIWHEIKEHEEELDKTIKAGELAEVHKIAFKIRDLSKALSEKSTDLPADQLAKVKSSVERIEEVAASLDRYGDAGDQANTEAEFARLGKLLSFIEKQYPESALKEGKGPHHEEGHQIS